MTYSELLNLCKSGKMGMIPGWKGYIKYNYSNNELYFINEDYIMKLVELEDKIKDRNDLYYII